MPVMIKRVVIYCILNVFYCAIKQYFCCKCSILFLGKKIFSKRTPESLFVVITMNHLHGMLQVYVCTVF